MQRVRDAHTLASNLAEELVRMEAEDKESFWNGTDFFDLAEMFLASLKVMGFEIENGSLGHQLAEAMQEDEPFRKSRFRFEITSNIKKLHGGKRSGYMFFVFWPVLHAALVSEHEDY